MGFIDWLFGRESARDRALRLDIEELERVQAKRIADRKAAQVQTAGRKSITNPAERVQARKTSSGSSNSGSSYDYTPYDSGSSYSSYDSGSSSSDSSSSSCDGGGGGCD